MEKLPEFKKVPAFQLYPKDLLSDPNVDLMDNDQLGGYLRLLCYEWMQGGLPTDEKELSKLSRMGRRWKTKGPLILRCFTRDGEKLIHPRLHRERLSQHEHRRKKREAGSKGAESRWHSHSNANGKRIANDSSSSSSSSSSAIRKEKKRGTPPAPLILFDDLPNILKTTEFFKAWEDWVQYRKERKKPLTVISIKKQILNLVEIGETRAIAAINNSIANQWQGIWEGTEKGNFNEVHKKNGIPKRKLSHMPWNG